MVPQRGIMVAGVGNFVAGVSNIIVVAGKML
jgi:hypothetical protein